MQPKQLKLGILGNPLAHSRSPQMQLAGLKYLGLEGSYEKFEVEQHDFATKLPELFSSLNGMNVTIPYKESIIKYLNQTDPLVEKIGAANTVVIAEGIIKGYNTDYQGFLDSLADFDFKDKSLAVIGAGGAAKAIMLALSETEAKEVKVFARNYQKHVGNLPITSKLDIELELFHEETNLENFDLIVNCTPVGQGRLSDEMPLTDLQIEQLKGSSTVYDLIYTDTKFLKTAAERGLKTINGSKMLIMQGVHAIKLWTGKKIDQGLIDTMSEAFYQVAA